LPTQTAAITAITVTMMAYISIDAIPSAEPKTFLKIVDCPVPSQGRYQAESGGNQG